MKAKLLVMFIVLAMASAPVMAQQDPNDAGNQDSIILVIEHQPDVSGIVSVDSTFTAELYFVNDMQNIVTATGGYEWDNDNVMLDSAIVTPLALTAFNMMRVVYYANNVDSSNYYQLFQFGGFRISGDGLATSTSRQHIATYHFHVNPWPNPGTDSCVIDSQEFTGGAILKFVDPDNVWWLPAFGHKFVIKDVAESGGLGTIDNLPLEFSVEQNYPNPFNPETTVEFALPSAGEWDVTIYNVLGQVVESFDGVAHQPGVVHVKWNAMSHASGVYFYRVEAGDQSETKKMMLVK